MPIIQGTDSDDVLYGDGKSQINGGKGNDTIYPYGGVGKEVILEPGNETYDFRNGNAPQILVPSNDPTAGRDTYINLTDQVWSINGRTVPARTIFDPYGGFDRIINTKNQWLGINIVHSSDRNEYVNGSVDFRVYPDFGKDYVESASISFDEWQKVNIVIPGYTGEISLGNSKLTYKNVSNWSFWNGEFDVKGSVQNEAFNLWGGKSIKIAGGGGVDIFQVMLSNRATITDFGSDDTLRLWNWFLTENDLTINQKLQGYSDAELRALIEITPNQIAGTTTLALKTLKPNQNPAIYTLNGYYELTSVSRTSNNDVDIRLNPIPIFGDGKSAIIKGTDGNDIIYGDGVGQIKAGAGDDTIYLTGIAREGSFDAGNDIFRVQSASQLNGVSFDFSIAQSDIGLGFLGPIINLTSKSVSVTERSNSKTFRLEPNTAMDPWGGIDLIDLPTAVNRIDLYPGNRDDFIYADARYGLFAWYNLSEETKTDQFVTENRPNFYFSGVTGSVIGIERKESGSTVNLPKGTIEILNSNVSGPYSGFDVLSDLKMSGSTRDESFGDWGSRSTISGGGGSDYFSLNGVNSQITITDFSNDDSLIYSWVSFVTSNSTLNQSTSADEFKSYLIIGRNTAKSQTNINISIPGLKPSAVTLDGLFDLSDVIKSGLNQYSQFEIKLAPSPAVGDGKSPLNGTSASDLIVPFGNLIGEIALSPGNDLFKFQGNDKVYYFANSPSYQSDGFLLNLGSNALTKNGLAILSGQLYDGYSGVDTLDFSNLASGFGIQLNIQSSPANDQIEISRGLFNSKVASVLLNLKPGFGSDSFYSDGSIRSTLQISGNASVSDINIIPSSSKLGGFYVNTDYLDLRNINEWFLLDAGASYNFTGDLNRQILNLGSSRTKVAAGPGPDDFIISSPGVRAEITDYSVDDRLIANWGFWTNYSAPAFSSMLDSDFRSKISLQFNISAYETTVQLESLSGLTASYILSGFFDKYDIVKSGLELEVRLTGSRVISRYTGDVLTSSAGKVGPWLVHDMTKAVTLTPYQDLVSFDASKVKTASLLSGFKSGADLLQLTASTAPAGASISANLENKNFLSGAGIKLPSSPEQYVIYDTSTGVVYFDQDGNGPSPTWPALILEMGTALVASDIQISKPQVYTLAGDRGVINEGETLSVLVGSSNVVAGTEVSYSITGISPFDVSGVKLTGSVKLDANGEALIKIPVAADGITEGLETLSLTLAGQVLAVPINDTSRGISADAIPPTPSAFAPADGALSVSVGSNLAVTFNEPITRGSGTVTLKTAAGSVVETFPATSNRVTVSGSTLTVDPTKNLDIYTRYVLDLGAGAVQDLAGNGSAATSQYDFRTETTDGLYHFFVVAFGAAPGVTYMGQLAEAANFGLSLQEIVEIFTTKTQFTSVYPTSLTNKELAARLVENIVKASATEVTKQSAAADIEAALGLGWSRGKVIYTVFGNLANKPLSDTTWGGTAKQFQNQLAVARYFTETLEGDSTSVGRLQAVLGNVNKDSDVSSSAKIAQLLNQPAYVVSADKSTVNEGAGIAFKVDSYGVAAGSAISYLLTGTNLTSADVVGGMLSGSVTLDSTGAGFITVQLAEDKTTEGTETLNLLLQGNPVKAVSILDTSITTTPINTDTTPPTLIGFNPMPGATNVAVGANFIFTFSETIKKGTGTIKLLDARGTPVESFNVQSSAQLSWQGTQLTVNPIADLINGTRLGNTP